MNFSASRPYTQTKNPERSFNTRVTGIFKKASALVKLVNNTNIAIYIERDGKQFYFETAPDLLPISKKEGIIHINCPIETRDITLKKRRVLPRAETQFGNT